MSRARSAAPSAMPFIGSRDTRCGALRAAAPPIELSEPPASQACSSTLTADGAEWDIVGASWRRVCGRHGALPTDRTPLSINSP